MGQFIYKIHRQAFNRQENSLLNLNSKQSVDVAVLFKHEWICINYKIKTSLNTLVFGLSFDFEFQTRNTTFVIGCMGGGGDFSLQYFSLLILRWCTGSLAW